MASKTNIEWTDFNWNFLRGCSRVSEGCRNCYAESIAARFSQPGQPYEGLARHVNHEARWTGEISFHEDILLKPLRWKKPRRVFVNSMSDLFHEKVTDEMLDKAFAVMALTPQHTYQILTKRPERMREYLDTCVSDSNIYVCLRSLAQLGHDWGSNIDSWLEDGQHFIDFKTWPLPNVWLAVSVEDQKTADERIPPLLQTPAAVRWISAEPLLGPVDLVEWPELDMKEDSDMVMERSFDYLGHKFVLDTELQKEAEREGWAYKQFCKTCGNREPNPIHTNLPAIRRDPDYAFLDWVVVGGESGHGARPCDIAWIRSIVGQCKVAGVPVFVKQLGAMPVRATTIPDGVNIADKTGWTEIVGIENRKGGDMSEWPEDLRVREFPTLEVAAK